MSCNPYGKNKTITFAQTKEILRQERWEQSGWTENSAGACWTYYTEIGDPLDKISWAYAFLPNHWTGSSFQHHTEIHHAVEIPILKVHH
jgi:hypothetical protein